MRYPGMRVVGAIVATVTMTVAAYAALYVQLQSIKEFPHPNVDITLNPVGLAVSFAYVTTANLLIAIRRRASLVEALVQVLAAPFAALLVFWLTGGAHVSMLCHLGYLAMAALAVAMACCPVSRGSPSTWREWAVAIVRSVALGSLSLGLLTCYSCLGCLTIIVGMGYRT